MGWITSWRNWSQKQYDLWGGSLQEKYDFWKDYDDPEFRKKCQAVWALMPEKMKKTLYKMLLEVLKDRGAKFAKDLIANIANVYIANK